MLRVLTEHQQISHSALANRTVLARAVAMSIAYELINAGLVRESAAAEVGETRSGRPTALLTLVPDCISTPGLGIAHDRVRAIMTDVVEMILWDHTRPTTAHDDPQQAVDVDSPARSRPAAKGGNRLGAPCTARATQRRLRHLSRRMRTMLSVPHGSVLV